MIQTQVGKITTRRLRDLFRRGSVEAFDGKRASPAAEYKEKKHKWIVPSPPGAGCACTDGHISHSPSAYKPMTLMHTEVRENGGCARVRFTYYCTYCHETEVLEFPLSEEIL